jgi:hypothetical protein
LQTFVESMSSYPFSRSQTSESVFFLSNNRIFPGYDLQLRMRYSQIHVVSNKLLIASVFILSELQINLILSSFDEW